jgi:hypothetical protein
MCTLRQQLVNLQSILATFLAKQTNSVENDKVIRNKQKTNNKHTVVLLTYLSAQESLAVQVKHSVGA